MWSRAQLSAFLRWRARRAREAAAAVDGAVADGAAAAAAANAVAQANDAAQASLSSSSGAAATNADADDVFETRLRPRLDEPGCRWPWSGPDCLSGCHRNGHANWCDPASCTVDAGKFTTTIDGALRQTSSIAFLLVADLLVLLFACALLAYERPAVAEWWSELRLDGTPCGQRLLGEP